MHLLSKNGAIIALLLAFGFIALLTLVQQVDACKEEGKGGYGKMKYGKMKPDKPWKEKPWKEKPAKKKKFPKAKANAPMVSHYYGSDRGAAMVHQSRGYDPDQGYYPTVSRSNNEPARGTTRRAFAKLLDAGVDKLLEHRKNRNDYGDRNRFQN